MAVSMIGPKFYAWDANGEPLAFGKVFTYQARTNSPKVSFQSEDAIVENENPVILNGEGYADIYLDGSYKIVVKDEDDNERWTADPVTAQGGEGMVVKPLDFVVALPIEKDIRQHHTVAFPGFPLATDDIL